MPKDLFDSLENLKAEAAGVKERAEELDGLKMELKDFSSKTASALCSRVGPG